MTMIITKALQSSQIYDLLRKFTSIPIFLLLCLIMNTVYVKSSLSENITFSELKMCHMRFVIMSGPVYRKLFIYFPYTIAVASHTNPIWLSLLGLVTVKMGRSQVSQVLFSRSGSAYGCAIRKSASNYFWNILLTISWVTSFAIFFSNWRKQAKTIGLVTGSFTQFSFPAFKGSMFLKCFTQPSLIKCIKITEKCVSWINFNGHDWLQKHFDYWKNMCSGDLTR